MGKESQRCVNTVCAVGIYGLRMTTHLSCMIADGRLGADERVPAP